MTSRLSANRICACGGPKDGAAKRCRKCHIAAMQPTEAMRAARREHVREYHRNYIGGWRKRRQEARGDASLYDECPQCQGRKHKSREVCVKCSDLALRAQSLFRKRRGELACWACDVPLRKSSWRGQDFLKCPTCGLEIKKAPMYVTTTAKEIAA